MLDFCTIEQTTAADQKYFIYETRRTDRVTRFIPAFLYDRINFFHVDKTMFHLYGKKIERDASYIAALLYNRINVFHVDQNYFIY